MYSVLPNNAIHVFDNYFKMPRLIVDLVLRQLLIHVILVNLCMFLLELVVCHAKSITCFLGQVQCLVLARISKRISIKITHLKSYNAQFAIHMWNIDIHWVWSQPCVLCNCWFFKLSWISDIKDSYSIAFYFSRIPKLLLKKKYHPEVEISISELILNVRGPS